MQILRECTELVGKLLPKGKVCSGLYVPSIFNYLSKQDEVVLVNTFSRCILKLNEEDELLLKQKSVQVDEADCDDVIRQMIEQRILVPEQMDETELYLQVYDILKILEGRKGKKTYEIFTTTACNAKCFYCFQEGFEVKSMTEETADALFEYIMRTKYKGTITLNWFGGEPLCNTRVITRICSKLKAENVPYISTLITNGYLLTRDTIKEAVELWNLKRCQISLDGMHEEYKRRKNYNAAPENPLETVLTNMEMLAQTDIKIDVRLNYDHNNIESILELAVYLKKRFGAFKNVFVYPSALRDEWYDYSNPTPGKSKEKLQEAAAEIRAILGALGEREAPEFSKNLPVAFCLANDPRGAVIDPEGNLYSCQHISEEFIYGNIWHGVTNTELYEKWIGCGSMLDRCRCCSMLPQCTAFGLCSIRPEDCYEKQCRKVDRRIKKSCLALN